MFQNLLQKATRMNIALPFLPKSVQFKHWCYIVLGSFLMASGFVLFITPYNIVPGGVYGLGISLHNLFPNIQVGTFGWLMDIPLLLTSFLVFGGKIGLKTITAAFITPLFMNAPVWIWGVDNPVAQFIVKMNLENDLLLSCIFGGVLIGAAMGLIFKTHATSGGTDIIGMIISKFMHIPLAKAVLFVDSLVVIVGLIVIGDWKLPLYSLIVIFISAKVMDFIIEGGENDKLLFILSKENEGIKNLIINELDRSGTYIKSAGMYTGDDKDMIFLVISRRELATVQDYVRVIDPKAFMVIVNAHETLGEGFKEFSERIGG